MSDFALANPLIVALDLDSAEETLRLSSALKGQVGAFKLGPRLLVRYGADLVQKVAACGPVFIDNKYLDIPNTMRTAVEASFEAGATLVTVHAWAGSEALQEMAQLEQKLNQIRPFKILVVTVLTSFNVQTLPPSFAATSIAEQVKALGEYSLNRGLTGLVCSPQEAAVIRSLSPRFYIVTPGVRMPEGAHHDQKRVSSPQAALAAGASAFVVGRPICEAADPVAAAHDFLRAAGVSK